MSGFSDSVVVMRFIYLSVYLLIYLFIVVLAHEFLDPSVVATYPDKFGTTTSSYTNPVGSYTVYLFVSREPPSVSSMGIR